MLWYSFTEDDRTQIGLLSTGDLSKAAARELITRTLSYRALDRDDEKRCIVAAVQAGNADMVRATLQRECMRPLLPVLDAIEREWKALCEKAKDPS